MTSPLAGSLAKTIGGAFKSLFFDAVLTRDGPTTGPDYDPTPGAPLTFACKAIVEVYSVSFRAAGLVQQNERRVLILAASLNIQDVDASRRKPQPGDVLTINGTTFSILEVETDPATAIWTCRGAI